MHCKSFFIIILFILALLLYFVLVELGDFRNQIIIYIIIFVAIFAIYIYFVFLVLRDTKNIGLHWGWFILFAFLARLILFPSVPFLSHEVYRYLWDGKVSACGINPYHYAPQSAELSTLQDNVIYPNIQFPEIATVYPPLAQLFFLINELLAGTLISWKIILLLAEVALTFMLLKLIKHFSLSEYRLVILICNPLIIIETYHSAHFDIIALTFFWLGIFTFYKQKDGWAFGALVSAIQIKFVPIIMALPFLIKKLWRNLFFILVAFIAILVPFTLNHTIPMEGFVSYVNRWSFNGAIFKSVTYLLDMFKLPAGEIGRLNLNAHTEIFYLNNEFYYKVLAAIVFVIIIFDQFRKLKLTANYRSINYIRASFIIIGVFLLLQPTLYPWYVIVIIPFLIFMPNWSWLIFTFLIQLSYFVVQNYVLYGIWKESTWVIFAEYIPFYSLLVFEYLDSRKIKGWFSE